VNLENRPKDHTQNISVGGCKLNASYIWTTWCLQFDIYTEFRGIATAQKPQISPKLSQNIMSSIAPKRMWHGGVA
jgi:hypothetical protein